MPDQTTDEVSLAEIDHVSLPRPRRNSLRSRRRSIRWRRCGNIRISPSRWRYCHRHSFGEHRGCSNRSGGAGEDNQYGV